MTYIPKIPISDLVEVTFDEAFKDIDSNILKQLENACKDGNINKNKCLIFFLTDNGTLKVYATIWMVGKKYVLLKENLYIPIKSIVKIK